MDDVQSQLLLNLASEMIGILFTVTILAWLLSWLGRGKWKAATDTAHAILWGESAKLMAVLYEMFGIDFDNPAHGTMKVINFHGEAIGFFRYTSKEFGRTFAQFGLQHRNNSEWEHYMELAGEVKPSIEGLVDHYGFLLDAELLGHLMAFSRHFETERPRSCALALWQVHRWLRDHGQVLTRDEWNKRLASYADIKKRPFHRFFEPEDNWSEYVDSYVSHPVREK